MIRPNMQEYFLLLALAARTRADCKGRSVGAVLTKDNRVLSTGYNGTPFGMTNCTEGGCSRCTNATPGSGYDVCICVHAEQNALLTAARFGQSTLGAHVTSTLAPCFGCLKELLQAGITEIYYLHSWEVHPDFADDYRALLDRFAVVRQLSPLPMSMWDWG